MSANPFDQFDSGGIASAPKTSNPFDKFDPAPPEPGLLETAARTIGSGATRALGAVPYLAGGIAGAVGANDTADKLFGAYEKARNIADVEQGPAPTSTAGRITQAVAGLPVGIATLGAASIPEAGAQVIRQGGTIQEALGQTALDTGANAAGLALGGLGKSVVSRVAGQGIAFGALGQASRVAGNAMRGPDQQEAFDPVQLGIDVGTGAGFGLLPHGHEATVTPPPAPELRGITHQPDFVTDAAGRTINNKGDQTLGQPVTGGPGMDQQGPGGPPPPAIPAPLALTHEPDVTVDSQGRAVINKGDKTLGQPFGGPGLDEQAPAKPAGPISAALDAGGVKPPEVPAPEAAAAPAPQPEAPSGATATPSLRDSYAARQSQIDALNSARKSDGLDDDSLNKLHDLRDVQDGHDALTGLLNQKGYDDAVASGQYTHAAALDLDQFKPINDTFGHKAGDAVLQHVAQILHDSSAGDVTVARIHGDEYAGLAKSDPTDAMAAAQKTLRESPFDIDYVDKDGNTHTHTFDGIGITYGVGKDYETADAAANAAKPKTGRRNTDTDTRSVRPEDVQTTAGGQGDGAAGGRQDDLQGAAREPATIKTSVGDVTVDRSHDIPLLGSSSKDGTVHIDKDWQPVIQDGPLKGLDRTPFLVEHAAVEAKAEKDGQNYSQSHYDHAEPAEHKMLLEHLGLKEGTPQADKAIEAYEASYKDDLKAAAAKKNPQVPPDLITKPYDHAHTEAQRRMMDEVDAQQTTAEEPVIASRNATQPSRRGVPKETVATALKEPISKLSGDAPKIFIHQSHEEAPPNLRNSKGFDRSVKGAFDPNTNSVHIFSDSIHTPREAQEVLTHEIVGHYGLEKIIGKDWPKLVNDLSLHRDKPSAAMRDVIKEVDQRYPGADRDTFASEAMAIMAERGVHNTFTDRVMAAVRKFVRSLGMNAKFSDAELRQMLVAAKRHVESDRTANASSDRPMMFHKAFHGSPHDFDKFDASKIGTGEGAQAYGHGLYFAGKKEVADHYRGKLANPVEDARLIARKHGLNTTTEGIAQQDEYARASMRIAKDASITRDQKITALEHQVPPARKLTAEQRGKIIDEVAANKGGRGYEVELAPKEHEYLDWDKPLSEQSPHVREAISKVAPELADSDLKGRDIYGHVVANHVLENNRDNGWTSVASTMNDRAGSQALGSKTLHDAGIRGIKYLDGSSRGKGDGHSNYVIFNDKDVSIQAKYSKSATGTKEEPKESFLDKATGLLRPNKAELASRAIKQVALQGRDLARGVARAAWAARDRAVGTADAAIDAFRSHFDSRPKDIRSDPSKAYADVIAYQQKKPIADPVAAKFIDTMAGMLDKQASAIRAFGEDKLGLLDQYFPQLWKDPGRAEKMYADMQAKRPLAGSKGFTKERVFEDYEAGIKAGMEPAFDNPADALMARYQSGERYLAALKIKDGINTLGMLKDIGQGDRVPVGFARVNDNTFAGKVVPEMVARDLNNYLAPGLSQFKAWRNFRWLQNVLLSARLGFSAFHAGFTTVDSAMTHLDLGFRKALSGDIAGALRHMGQIPLTPIHAVQGLFNKGEGAKLVRQFYGKEAADPQTAAVLDALTQGGARGRMDPTDYNNDFAQQLRAWKTDGIQGLMKTPLKNIGAVLEAAMRPIAHNLVPAQKMTARAELMKYELDRVAKKLGEKKGDYAAITKAMNPDALKQIAHSVVSRVDDRLGQVAYDNLFWNRTVKDLLQASIQSVGWNLGTKNVIFGGLADAQKLLKPESLLAPLDKEGKITDATMSRVTGRLSYLIALNVGIGTLGAMTQYMLTGQGPQELKDYFFPKTGNKNPDGTDARISFPSYVKDEFGFARHPIDTVEHKLHPSFSMIAELLNNKDFYGNQIVNPDDPWTKVAGQVAGYVGKGFVPYAVQNQNNIEQAGGGIAARLAPFVGVTPAPGSETHSQAQSYIADRYYAAHPNEGKTPEAAAHSKEFSASINAIRQGQTPDLSSFTPAERQKIVKYAHEDPATLVEKHFAKLPLSQQLTAYDKATEAERAQYKMKIAINRVASKALQNETDSETRDRLKERLESLRGQ